MRPSAKRLAGVLIGAGLALVPAAAWGQTAPTPTVTAPTSTVGPVPAIPDKQVCAGIPQSGGLFSPPKYLVPGPNGGFQLEDEMHACSLQGQQATHDQAKSFMDGVLPDGTGSQYPLSSYDVGSSSSLSHGAGVVWGLLMNAFFTASVWIVSAGLLVVGWAMQFPFTAIGSKVANEVSGLLTSRVVLPLGLGRFALMICAVAAVFHLFRGRAGRAITEIATAMVALVLASFILANPGAILRSAFRVESQIVTTLLSLGSNSPAPVGDAKAGPLAPLTKAVVEADIHKPYMLINWGSVLTGKCRAIADEALSLGPWGDADAPRDTMRKVPECVAAANFNESGTVTRMFSAFFDMLNAIASTGLMMLVGLAMLVAELGAVGIMAVAVLAIIAACFPNPIRSFAWRWVESALRVQIVIVVSAFLLSFWAILLTAVLDQMAGSPLILEFLVMTCMSILSVIVFLGAIRRAPQMARQALKPMEQEGLMPAKKSHGGAFGLGLGMVGLGDAMALKSKVNSLMPAGHQSRKIVKAVHSLSDETKQLNKGWEPEGPYTGPDAPKGPGALSTTVYAPYGDGRWRPDADHVKSERVPPRTDYSTTPDVMDEAQNRLANPYQRPTITLPVSNPRKVQAQLPPGGHRTPPIPAW